LYSPTGKTCRSPLPNRVLPELLSFFSFFQHLWHKLRTTNIIERFFVEVRRRTRPMVCFVNVESLDRIIHSIFQRFTRLEEPLPRAFYTSGLTSPSPFFSLTPEAKK